jgi:inosine-uridine preferring nucleoside hydrolase
VSPRLEVRALCRVVVDNDFSGDPDGLLALAHHLLAPSNRVVLVTSSFLNPSFPGPPPPTAADGAALAAELVEVVGGVAPPVVAGSEHAFDPAAGAASAAADAIIAEARRDDPLPLFLVCGGPLTNVAEALRRAPDIAGRVTLVWIGGSLREGAYEYNRDTDPGAAQYVFRNPALTIHQFPVEAYRRCAYSVAELEHDVGGSGRLGEWLWEHFTSPPEWAVIGGHWPLGDSPPLLVTALTDESSTYAETPADEGRGARRVYSDVGFRLIVGDLLARLRLHERDRRGAVQV